ncbi:MAG: hypothetical protein CMF70_05000 [Magnetovibrio sp.]|nr:hypothetical protein [Magnetovibrio sp.]
MPLRIGIDLGGTKTEGVVIDNLGNTISCHRKKTPINNYAETINTICEIVSILCNEVCLPNEAPVGIGIPGALSMNNGLVKNANSVWLIGRPLGRDLKVALSRDVRIENDANCFTVSEAFDGAGKGLNIVFGIILGTGVGGGVTINGKVWSGKNLIAGEWGHNPLPWPASPKDSTYEDHEQPGPPCYCGKSGWIETFLSGPGLALDHGTGDSAKKINTLAIQGDTLAQASLKRYENRLARALSTIINTIDPDAIILGGGLSNIGSLYNNVPLIWDRWVFSDNCKTSLLKNVHGDSSGARGAAWLWNS